MRKEIQYEWEVNKRSYEDLSKEYGVPTGTIKSWAHRDHWKRDGEREYRAERVEAEAEIPEIDKEDMSSELTDREKLFCIHYLKSFNQTSSAIKAGYSPKRAHVTGSELMSNSKILAEIARLKGEIHERLFVDTMDVLKKYIKIAFADMTDVIDFDQVETTKIVETTTKNETGETTTIETVPYTYTRFAMKSADEVDGSLITELSRGRDGMFKVKLADKMKALEMLTKYYDVLDEKTKQTIQIEKLRAETERLKKDNTTAAPPNIIIVDEWADNNDD